MAEEAAAAQKSLVRRTSVRATQRSVAAAAEAGALAEIRAAEIELAEKKRKALAKAAAAATGGGSVADVLYKMVDSLTEGSNTCPTGAELATRLTIPVLDAALTSCLSSMGDDAVQFPVDQVGVRGEGSPFYALARKRQLLGEFLCHQKTIIRSNTLRSSPACGCTCTSPYKQPAPMYALNLGPQVITRLAADDDDMIDLRSVLEAIKIAVDNPAVYDQAGGGETGGGYRNTSPAGGNAGGYRNTAPGGQ